MTRKILVADLLCGAGGSTGCRRALAGALTFSPSHSLGNTEGVESVGRQSPCFLFTEIGDLHFPLNSTYSQNCTLDDLFGAGTIIFVLTTPDQIKLRSQISNPLAKVPRGESVPHWSQMGRIKQAFPLCARKCINEWKRHAFVDHVKLGQQCVDNDLIESNPRQSQNNHILLVLPVDYVCLCYLPLNCKPSNQASKYSSQSSQHRTRKFGILSQITANSTAGIGEPAAIGFVVRQIDDSENGHRRGQHGNDENSPILHLLTLPARPPVVERIAA